MKVLTKSKIVVVLSLVAIITIANVYLHQPIALEDAKPLITGRWLYNPGACAGKLPRNGFFDISIFMTNPDDVVVNKIVLDEGHISNLDINQIQPIQEEILSVFSMCEAIKQPKSTPTMFHYKHPLKEFSLVYYPKEDLLIKTNQKETLLFQRFSSINMSTLTVVDSL